MGSLRPACRPGKLRTREYSLSLELTTNEPYFRILPEHLYPKFRLQLDKFKDQNPNVDITDDTDKNSIHSQQIQEPTGDQRVERAMKSNNQNNTDEIIRQMISNIRKEPINFPPNLTDIKRPRSYNKKKDSKRDKISTP